MIDITNEVPYIHNRMELKRWLKPMYIIEDYTESYETYDKILKQLANIIRGCYVIRECREYPIKVKFTKKSKNTMTLQLRHFFVNMILWLPLIDFNDLNTLDESFCLDCFNDVPHINDFINTKLILPLRMNHIINTKINHFLSKVLYTLRYISIDFADIIGVNFSLVTFMDMYNKYPEIRDMMEVTFPKNMQPYEIEDMINKYEKREIEIYESDPGNPIGLILKTNTGIKKKQFGEYTLSQGNNPSIDGNTIPETIDNSVLIGGLNKPSYLYIGAIGARKSLIMNKLVMGKAGHFGKIMAELCRTLSLSTEVSDCGSKHLVKYDINSLAHLKKLDGKFYKLDKSDPDLKILKFDSDKDIVGKSIYVRSIATCCLGDKVCARCFGNTAIANFDIADGVSSFESQEVSKVINQGILSVKHLLSTHSEKISFNSDFYNFFSILGSEISVNINESIDNINDLVIYIDPNNVIKAEELDDDVNYNTYIDNGTFYIRDIKHKDIPDIEIKCDTEKELFFTDECLDIYKSNNGVIPFKDLDNDTVLWEITIFNKELTKPLYDLMNLINKKRDNDMDIDEISNQMLSLIIDAGIDANQVSSEIIINRLIRDTKHIYSRPDFSKPELDEYNIVTLDYALQKNASPLVGISYQDIKKQFLNEDFYTDRESTSYIDPFYMKEIEAHDTIKKYKEISLKDTDGDEF